MCGFVDQAYLSQEGLHWQMRKGGGDSDVYEHVGGWAGATSVQSADDDDPRNFVIDGRRAVREGRFQLAAVADDERRRRADQGQ